MDLVFCPNGHPNRPGRAQCVVCKAPLPLPPESQVPPPVRPPLPPRSAPRPTPDAAPLTPAPQPTDATSPETSPTPTPRRWPALLLLGLLILAIVATWLLWPRLRDDTATQPSPPAATVPSLPIVAPTEPPATAPPSAAPSTPGNLIAGGDFAAGWEEAWASEGPDGNGETAITATTFASAPAPAGLQISQAGAGTTRLQQTIDLPGPATDLRFSSALRLVGSAASDGAEGRAALMLTYLDENDAALGYSVWIDGSQPASTLWGQAPLPVFGPQLSPRYALDETWQTIDVDLADELLNRLPGVEPERVRRIGVNLLALGSETCAPSGCPITLEAAALQLLPAAGP